MTETQPTRRRWYQFRLRTLLIVVAIVAVPLAWVAKERRQSRHEAQIANQLTELGCDIWLGGPFDTRGILEWMADKPANWRSRLARRILGERIYLVQGHSYMFADFTALAQLKNVRWISASDGSVADLTSLSGLTSLNVLSLSRTNVRDLKPLAELTNLETLALNNMQVDDLTPLAGLKKLKYLGVFDSPVTKEQFEALKQALPDCKIKHDQS